MNHYARYLAELVGSSDSLSQVYKMNLFPGDYIYVKTFNSLYRMRVIGQGWFDVSGGWFDRKGISPLRVRINGCTWGGSVIKVNVAAACGLRLEFGNRVVTSPIKKIFVFQQGIQN